MHQKSKNSCIFFSYPIKYHHGDNGKMPWTGSIGSRYYHRHTTYGKHDQSSYHSQIGRKAEAEKGYVKFQKITQPNAYRIKKEQWHIPHMLNRENTFPYIFQDAFQFGKYRHIAYQEKNEETLLPPPHSRWCKYNTLITKMQEKGMAKW